MNKLEKRLDSFKGWRGIKKKPMAKTEKPGVVKGQWFSDGNLYIGSVAC